MTTTKVQIEATRESEIEDSVLSIGTIGDHHGSSDSPPMAGLMLGMQLRESLSDQDRLLLNKLAPPDRSVFLVYRGRFVHPEKFDTFPLDHIGGCAGEQAFFSHRFCPEDEQSGQASTIQTAVLNLGEPNSLLYGWVGPEITTLDGSWDHRFSRSAEDLRRAYSESAALAHRLQAQLKTEVPTLIIDRLTERLLWLNKPAAELCGQERSALVDLRFEQVRTILSRTLTRRRLTMKQVSAGEIEVTMVTLPLAKSSTHTSNRFASDFPVHPSQERLATIIMAADLLKSSLTQNGDSEGVELSNIIACEARDMYDFLCTEMISNPHKILETE